MTDAIMKWSCSFEPEELQDTMATASIHLIVARKLKGRRGWDPIDPFRSCISPKI